MQKGLIERFRSLPMARSAVLAGRTVADLVRNVFVVLLMVVVGTAVGFRVHTSSLGRRWPASRRCCSSPSPCTWVFAIIGLKTADPRRPRRRRSRSSSRWCSPRSAFVPTATMPGWLQVFANHQPVTVAVNAVRALMLGATATPQQRELLLGGASTGSLVLQSLAWTLGIGLLFAILCTRRYRGLSR